MPTHIRLRTASAIAALLHFHAGIEKFAIMPFGISFAFLKHFSFFSERRMCSIYHRMNSSIGGNVVVVLLLLFSYDASTDDLTLNDFLTTD